MSPPTRMPSASSTCRQHRRPVEKSGLNMCSTPGWFTPAERDNDLRRNHSRSRYRRFRIQYVDGGNLKQKSIVIGNGIFRSLGDDTNQDRLNTSSVEISKCAHQFVMTVLKADSRRFSQTDIKALPVYVQKLFEFVSCKPAKAFTGSHHVVLL